LKFNVRQISVDELEAAQ